MQQKYKVIAVTVFFIGLVGLLGMMQWRVVRAEEAAHQAKDDAEQQVQQVLADMGRLLAQQQKMQQDYEERFVAQRRKIARLLAAQPQRIGTR